MHVAKRRTNRVLKLEKKENLKPSKEDRRRRRFLSFFARAESVRIASISSLFVMFTLILWDDVFLRVEKYLLFARLYTLGIVVHHTCKNLYFVTFCEPSSIAWPISFVVWQRLRMTNECHFGLNVAFTFSCSLRCRRNIMLVYNVCE